MKRIFAFVGVAVVFAAVLGFRSGVIVSQGPLRTGTFQLDRGRTPSQQIAQKVSCTAAEKYSITVDEGIIEVLEKGQAPSSGIGQGNTHQTESGDFELTVRLASDQTSARGHYEVFKGR